MSFLQPWILLALPLIAVPLIVHLVNQRRFQTVPWAAMMFLLQASKMSSGYTKLRQWLILLMRTLAVASLIFFTSRPLASGLLGLMGSRSSEAAIIILDRSPSMQETPTGSGLTKLEAGLIQLASTLKTLGMQRIVVFDSAQEKPIEFESADAMANNPSLVGNGITTDIPELLEKALAYIKNNQFGNTNIWVCSDLRESDWRSRDGRWVVTREGFLELPQDIQFNLLDLSSLSRENLSVRMESAKRLQGPQGPELALSFKMQRNVSIDSNNPNTTPIALQVPVEIEVSGSRSVLNVELQGESAEVNDYRIALPADKSDPIADRGWGLIRIPADTNNADNTSYFVYEKPAARRTVIVTDNPNVIEAIELCTNIAPDQSIQCLTETVPSSQLESVDWDNISMVVWHERLPQGKALEILSLFLAQGGQVLFFPPENPTDSQSLGIQWTGWETLKNASEPTQDTQSATLARVQQWRNDSELLGNTLNGAPLPVGQLGIKRICRVQGEGTVLASIQDELPLLMRIDTPGATKNGVYVCTTTPSIRDSTLAVDGIVMYIAIQRVLAAGSTRIGTTKSITAGQLTAGELDQAVQESGETSVLSNQYNEHAGVYRQAELLYSLNRQSDEDSGRLVGSETLAGLFGNLHWARIESGATAKSLVQEIWRWFVIAMLLTLVIEAVLCIPKRKTIAIPGTASSTKDMPALRS